MWKDEAEVKSSKPTKKKVEPVIATHKIEFKAFELQVDNTDGTPVTLTYNMPELVDVEGPGSTVFGNKCFRTRGDWDDSVVVKAKKQKVDSSFVSR